MIFIFLHMFYFIVKYMDRLIVATLSFKEMYHSMFKEWFKHGLTFRIMA